MKTKIRNEMLHGHLQLPITFLISFTLGLLQRIPKQIIVAASNIRLLFVEMAPMIQFWLQL